LFHASPSSRKEDTLHTEVATQEIKESSGGFKWEPIYSVPLGIAFAVPALKYEWILVNEEMQVCLMILT
jgi:hypothetical protein